MKKLICKLLAFLPFCAAAQQPFEIKGNIGAWNAPAKVYLAYKTNNVLTLDSAKINGGSFTIKGKVPSLVMAVLVLDRTSVGYMNLNNALADYKQFYLGGEKITVSSADSMKNAIISNSRINDSANAVPQQLILEPLQLEKGEIAPAFEQPDSAGKMIQLADFRGKVVLVDFWASWCMPCRAENPGLVKAYQKYNNKGFEILSVSVDDKKNRNAWLDAIKQDSMNWIHVSDLKGADNEAAKIYMVQYIPQNFLIGRDGKILATNIRGEDLPKKLEEVFSNN